MLSTTSTPVSRRMARATSSGVSCSRVARARSVSPAGATCALRRFTASVVSGTKKFVEFLFASAITLTAASAWSASARPNRTAMSARVSVLPGGTW